MLHRRRFNALLAGIAAATCLCWLPANATAAGKEIVKFRLQSWKSLHIHDPEDAKKLYKTLTTIGCEAKQESHGDHFDVRYRCSKWKQLTLSSHADAHRWEDWLKKIGFETLHEH